MKIQANMRQSNFEVMRIVAMMMIVVAHLLQRCFIVDVYPGFTLNGLVIKSCYLLGQLGNVLFILLSGWFISETTFSWKKVAKLWFEVFFYSVVIGSVFFAFRIPFCARDRLALFTGWTDEMRVPDVKDFLRCFFPVIQSHNWFATSYLGFFMFSPFLAALTANLPKERHKTLAVLSLFLGSWPLFNLLGGSSFPFFTLYFVVSYIKRFPPRFLERPRRCFVLGMVTFALIVAWNAAVIVAAGRIGFVGQRLDSFLGLASGTNKLPTVLCGLFFFCGVRNSSVNQSRCINAIAASTFGVYLIHSNYFVARSPRWAVCSDVLFSSPWMIPYVLGLSLSVFAVCIVIDMLRKRLFAFVAKGFVLVRRG